MAIALFSLSTKKKEKRKYEKSFQIQQILLRLISDRFELVNCQEIISNEFIFYDSFKLFKVKSTNGNTTIKKKKT